WRVLDRFARREPVPPPPHAAAPAAAKVATLPQQAVARPLPSPRPLAEEGREGADLLVLRDVGLSFGGLRALDGINLAIPEGGLYGIIGPNGAGKTTLFNVINGFLAADRGAISFAGEPITGLQPNQVCRRGIDRTFQVVRAFPRMTALENVII